MPVRENSWGVRLARTHVAVHVSLVNLINVDAAHHVIRKRHRLGVRLGIELRWKCDAIRRKRVVLWRDVMAVPVLDEHGLLLGVVSAPLISWRVGVGALAAMAPAAQALHCDRVAHIA